MEINEIINNYENGNISIFQKELNKLNKLQMINLIIEWGLIKGEYTYILNVLHRSLKNE